MAAQEPSDRLQRFSSWLGAYGDCWEAGLSDGLEPLLVVGATFQPTPFEPLLRGRRAIVAWFDSQLSRGQRPSFVAQVLGVGETYGVAHFRVSSADRALDGVMVVALDDRGRCTSLRQWWHEGEGPVISTAPTSLWPQRTGSVT
jgi:hypothetical protein